MKNIGVLLLLACLSVSVIQPLGLERVNEWMGVRNVKYLFTLINNQVLCVGEADGSHGNKSQYYIEDYITGELIYRFEGEIRLYTNTWDQLVKDQYGVYIFLEKDGGLVLFDVEARREYIPGEPLKRPEYIYYTQYIYQRGRGDMSDNQKLLKHNIITGKIDEVYLGNLSRDERSSIIGKVEDIGGNRLLLYTASSMHILQLNESMTEVISMSEIIKGRVKYMLPIDKDNYIGFKVERFYPGDYVSTYSVVLMDENGRIQREDKSMDLSDYRMTFKSGIDDICLLGVDKQYVLIFRPADTRQPEAVLDVFVCRIIYGGTFGTLNDDRVRVRASPDLSGEILGMVSRGNKIEILEIGQEKQRVGDLESVWYRIRTDANVEGWVFGAYVDIR
jgi:hypothetical protein